MPYGYSMNPYGRGSWNYGHRRGNRLPYRNVGYTGRFGGPLKPEKKFLDTALAAATISATGTNMANGTTEIIEIVQGTGENERNGSRVRIQSLHGRIFLTLPGLTGAGGEEQNTHDIVRIMIGIDKQCNGAVISVGDLLEGTDIHTFRNIENLHRFKWLYDVTHQMNTICAGGNGTAIETCASQMYISINLPMNVPIYYDGATGAVAEIRSHNIFAFAISESGRAKMQNSWRVRYYG